MEAVPILGLGSLLGWVKNSQNGDYEFILLVLSTRTFKSYHFSQAKSEVICSIIFFWERDERKLTHSKESELR